MERGAGAKLVEGAENGLIGALQPFGRPRVLSGEREEPMTKVASRPVTEASLTILKETFEGPSGSSTYYIDNDPRAGLFATLDGLAAEAASQPFGARSATIAGHAFHLGFHLETSSAWLRGDREPRDWSRSWSVTAVDERGWEDLRRSLRRQFEDVLAAIESETPEDVEALATTIGAIAHAAYHLGAIRQHLASA
jgi:hypothetical protein